MSKDNAIYGLTYEEFMNGLIYMIKYVDGDSMVGNFPKLFDENGNVRYRPNDVDDVDLLYSQPEDVARVLEVLRPFMREHNIRTYEEAYKKYLDPLSSLNDIHEVSSKEIVTKCFLCDKAVPRTYASEPFICDECKALWAKIKFEMEVTL